MKTGGGNDVLSIAGILDLAGRNKNNLRTKVIDADLGNGYNVLSFAPIPEKTGTRYNYDTRKWIIDRTFYPNSKEYVKGIRFNFQTKEAVYSILREEISNIASWENRSLGTIRGVKVLDSSPFDDYIILDISEDEKGKSKELEDFAIFNQKGRNSYTIHNVDTEDTYIRKYFIFDTSNRTAKLNLMGYQTNFYKRITIKDGTEVSLYNSDTETPKPNAIIKFVTNNFYVYNENGRIDKRRFGVSYRSGNAIPYYINNGGSLGIYATNTQDDQLILRCDDGVESTINNHNVAIDLKGGENTLAITRNFLDDCGIETPTKAEGEEDEDSDEEYVATMDVVKTAPSTLKLTIKYESSNKIVTISNVQKIQNGYGSTVLEVDQLNSDDSVVDLVKEAYWKDDDFVKGMPFNSFHSLLYFKIRYNVTYFQIFTTLIILEWRTLLIFQIFSQINRKTPISEPLFDKAAGSRFL